MPWPMAYEVIAGIGVLVTAGGSDNQRYPRKVRTEVVHRISVTIDRRLMLSTKNPHCAILDVRNR